MKKYHKWILEGWASWEALRKLGFSADDIFWEFVHTVNVKPRPGFALNIVLRTQDRVFVITCSHRLSSGESKALLRKAKKFQRELADGHFDEAEMRAIYEESFVAQNGPHLILALQMKGFVIPCIQN